MKEYRISEIAQKLNLTYQALYVAMRAKKLIGFKKSHEGARKKWTITEEAVKKWIEQKYKRTKGQKPDGTPIYNGAQNQFSITEASQKFEVPEGRLYYLIRRRKLPFTRYRHAYVLTIDDASKFRHLIESYEYKKTTQRKD